MVLGSAEFIRRFQAIQRILALVQADARADGKAWDAGMDFTTSVGHGKHGDPNDFRLFRFLPDCAVENTVEKFCELHCRFVPSGLRMSNLCQHFC
jgi:hypothetical protein